MSAAIPPLGSSRAREELAAAKQRFSEATAAALAGDDAAWHRAEIASRDVRRLLVEINAGHESTTRQETQHG